MTLAINETATSVPSRPFVDALTALSGTVRYADAPRAFAFAHTPVSVCVDHNTRRPPELRVALRRASTALAPPESRATEFLNEVERADNRDVNDAILAVYRRVDEWLSAGQFVYCDAALRLAGTRNISHETLIGLLTICRPARPRLTHYGELFRRVREILLSSRQAQEVAEALRGLE